MPAEAFDNHAECSDWTDGTNQGDARRRTIHYFIITRGERRGELSCAALGSLP